MGWSSSIPSCAWKIVTQAHNDEHFCNLKELQNLWTITKWIYEDYGFVQLFLKCVCIWTRKLLGSKCCSSSHVGLISDMLRYLIETLKDTIYMVWVLSTHGITLTQLFFLFYNNSNPTFIYIKAYYSCWHVYYCPHC